MIIVSNMYSHLIISHGNPLKLRFCRSFSLAVMILKLEMALWELNKSFSFEKGIIVKISYIKPVGIFSWSFTCSPFNFAIGKFIKTRSFIFNVICFPWMFVVIIHQIFVVTDIFVVTLTFVLYINTVYCFHCSTLQDIQCHSKITY